MAKQSINIGTSANDRTGDSLRSAFNKINENFTDLYTALGLDEAPLNLGAFEFTGSVLTTTDSSAIVIDQATTITSNLTVGGDVVPSVAYGGDLGTADKPWRSLYVSGDTVFIGGTPIRIDENGDLTVDGSVVTSGAVSYNDLTNIPTIQSFNQDLNTTDSVTFNTVTTPNLVLDGDVTTLNELFIDGGAQAIGIKSQINIVVDGDVTFQNGNITGLTGNLDGDVTGSVFADDSTLLVDGVNGVIPYSVLSGAPSFGNWTFSSNTLSENSTGDAVIQSSTFAGSKLILQTRGPTDKQWIFDQDGDLTAPGDITITGMLTVEESFSSTPTTKFFEIETGAGNNRLLRTGVNMSAFAQGDGPQLDLTSYRSSPANGDAGPELVLRASTGASVNDVIATIGTQVTDTTDGDVTSKISFTVQNNGAEITPLSISGSTVDMQTADQVSISNENGAVDIYGEVEFNNGTTTFTAGNSVDFNCPVDFSGATITGDIPGYVQIADLKTALQDGAGDYAAFKAWVLANL